MPVISSQISLSLRIQRREWDLLNAVIRAAAPKWGECSWLGIGAVLPGGILDIRKIVYPPQVNSAGATDMDDQALAGVLAASVGDGERVLWWGHSHGDGTVFYSAKDETTWAEWMSSAPEIFLGTCHNSKGETWQRLRLAHCSMQLATFPLEIVEPVADAAALELAMSAMKGRTYAPPSGQAGKRRRRKGEKESVSADLSRGGPDLEYLTDILTSCRMGSPISRVGGNASTFGNASEYATVWALEGAPPTFRLDFDGGLSYRRGYQAIKSFYVSAYYGADILAGIAYLTQVDCILRGEGGGLTFADMGSNIPSTRDSALNKLVVSFFVWWQNAPKAEIEAVFPSLADGGKLDLCRMADDAYAFAKRATSGAIPPMSWLDLGVFETAPKAVQEGNPPLLPSEAGQSRESIREELEKAYPGMVWG